MSKVLDKADKVFKYCDRCRINSVFMTRQDKLKQMLNKRNPLLETKREAVTPVDLYTKPQSDKTTSGQVVKDTKLQTAKPAKPQVVKYTTHLRTDLIKGLKRYALDYELKHYTVVQIAIEKFLSNTKEREVRINNGH